MGLTSERKIFLGLAGVAGIALFIDQGVLGPKDASADILPVIDQEIVESAPVVTDSPLAQLPAAAILIDRLKSKNLSGTEGSFGSAFSLLKLVEPSPIQSSNSNGVLGIEVGQVSQGSFPTIAPKATDLPALSAVMPSRNGGGAVIGGKLLRIDQVGPSGYRLVVVMARSVLVERDGVQYAIEMPTSIGRN